MSFVRIAVADGFEECLSAWSRGGLAVTEHGSGWSITHLQSGYTCGIKTREVEDAVWVAGELLEVFDWRAPREVIQGHSVAVALGGHVDLLFEMLRDCGADAERIRPKVRVDIAASPKEGGHG